MGSINRKSKLGQRRQFWGQWEEVIRKVLNIEMGRNASMVILSKVYTSQ